jgi:hypothetical protein
VALTNEEKPASEIIEEMVAGAGAVLRQAEIVREQNPESTIWSLLSMAQRVTDI